MSYFPVRIIKSLNNLLFDVRNVQIRNMTSACKLIYTEYGDPAKVVNLEKEDIIKPKGKDVLVRMIAAPVNPADINTIQGKYPVKPTLPSIPGNEGVGEVIEIGEDVSNVKVGDRVVPLQNALGTWRTHTILNESKVLKIPKKLGLIEAATLTVNPCTAYRMLHDFVELHPGDLIIQNGANSACGQNVIQLARNMCIKTINIVRNRPEIEDMKKYLTDLGATEVLTEEELRTTEIFKTGKYVRPKLALNCIGGKNALEILRHMEHSGKMVTYGGMSRDPVTVPTSALIFKNLTLHGFWMTQWTKENLTSEKRIEMFNDIIEQMVAGQLKGPAYTMIPFENYQEALSNTMNIQGFVGRKYILDFNKTV